ncbi:MAG: bifunctional 4-hydroxy-2-oxoglutarate aldolase/2-dehydro-3-deoxy-phosphogluconate aldolase [Pseudomonadales bacterium]|nr:bifunctional 4-hydroxy-2-oxoglutarate aldolase/2-dehydro-3-deoxy-phosphogluconate aldolase [Halioglobus sp.]MCP5128879.1 bifunctional 4-hydroxy-2-oxoglutarate aldolase/2-dehydro-3-deoxy-phosphogluconate aldolase [Pseudomonadales bacterium]
MSFAEQLGYCRVLPVITVHNIDATVQLAQALARGGMKALEITLRTPAALESLGVIKAAVPGMLIAAGTVTNPDLLDKAAAAGADFCVSPGLTPALLRASSDSNIRLLPGVASASEVMLGLDHGLKIFKLFPAVAVGGIELLKSLAGPFPDVRFCPTGGLNAANFQEFLALPNVICCGGSWMVSADLVDNGKWEAIEALARAAMTDV